MVLLNFWATWCIPCRVEIPDLVRLQQELGGQGLQIVGVSTDEEGFEVVRPFAEEMGINYPLVVDTGASVIALMITVVAINPVAPQPAIVRRRLATKRPMISPRVT